MSLIDYKTFLVVWSGLFHLFLLIKCMWFAFICFGFLGFFISLFVGLISLHWFTNTFFITLISMYFIIAFLLFIQIFFCCLVVLLYSLWLITRIVFLLQYVLSNPKTFYPNPLFSDQRMLPCVFYYNTGSTVFHTDICPYSLRIWGCPIRVCWWLWFPFDLGSRFGDSFIICFNDF